MIELPEAAVLADQINACMSGKVISGVTAAASPHKFAWYSGDPEKYSGMLAGRTIDSAVSYGGMAEIRAGGMSLVFSDGVGLRAHGINEARPRKHQLLIEFDDGSALSASVQMYGGLLCFETGSTDNEYYAKAIAAPSPLSDNFDRMYFQSIVSDPGNKTLCMKAMLATGQRIPGLGNGVLQDILFSAGIHPKKKAMTLSDRDKDNLYHSIKSVLSDMTRSGGRDTEKDLFDRSGGYAVRLSKNTAGKPCPICGSVIQKESFMGGSIYFCPVCQKS